MYALIDAAFDRNRTIVMLLLFLLASGIVAYRAIPKESEPDVPIPIIYVSMSHDGISPDDAERLLVRPMEKELQSISGLKEISSTASEGHASVLLEFDAGFDGDTALADVRERVDAAKSQLPAATDEPTVNEVNIALFPVLNISLSGPLPERTLIRIARNLKDKLEALPGVLEADIAGEREEVLEIVVDPLVMESYQMDFDSIFALISRNNLLVAAGAIDTGAGRMVLKVPGVIENLNDVMKLPVKVTDVGVVTFGDVASIRRTYKDPDSFARLNGQPTLVLEISKRLGANIIETIEAVRQVIQAESARLPANLDIGYHQDKSEQTRIMLTDLQNNVISGVVLVMIVIMATLGIRSSILVGFAIPGSFLTGILVIHAMGHTMNVVVLFSLILVVGMLVDGAIIITELADRNIDAGMSTQRAYANASKRMAWPVIASTFTTLAVFFPLLFWPGLIGQFMKYMPITVISCLLASLAMALIFIPVIGKFIGRRGTQANTPRLGTGATPTLAGSRDITAGSAVRREQDQGHEDRLDQENHAIERLLADAQGFKRRYLHLLHSLLRKPVTTLVSVLLFTIASYVVYGIIGKGVEFFPKVEPESMAVQVHARGDLSIYEKDSILKRVEERLFNRDEIESVYTRTGSSGQDDGGDIIGTINLEFIDWDQRRKAVDITAELREELSDIAGIRVEFAANEGGPDGGGKPINIQVSAPTGKLDSAVDTLREIMHRQQNFVDVSDNRPLPGVEWRLKVDREEAARYGADVALIGNAIQLVTSGIRVAGYRPDDATDELDIRVRYPIQQRNLDQIAELRVPTRNGMAPISHFVSVGAAPKTGVIKRAGGRRVITVEADVAKGKLVDTELKILQQSLLEQTADPEINIEFKGEAEEQQETMTFLVMAFISAVFLMTLILVTQFNSLYQAFLVLTAIVFSTSGVLIGLMITGQTFGIVMVGIGIIALAGIVVNNNIVLIDTYNSFKRQGAPAIQAALITGSVRARPVLLTAITTILGLVPMVFSMNIDLIDRELSFGAPSTQWWTQLSSAIAGGLAFTTLLTLFLTPCLLVLGARFSERLATRSQKRSVAGRMHLRT
ncbi:MAG: efflux RND transporter permease subunit [Granulosicoccus sp.]|nr:efflux RND transporter permease subunit [Granulosicoccus sp.]